MKRQLNCTEDIWGVDMKRALIIILFFILISAGGGSSVFGSNMAPGEEKAKIGLAMSLTSLKKYDEALKILEELHKAFPDDKMVDIELTNSLYEAGLTSRADAELAGILKQKSYDSKTALRLVAVLADRKRYREAVKICEGMLAEEPDNREAGLWLARLLSWDGQYWRSLREYAHLIDKNRDWYEPRIEKARVLGWDHRYSASIKEYENTMREMKTAGEVARLEITAKKDYYNRFDLKGIKDYEKWLASEPDNLEALFDLAQIRSRNMQWSKAKELYDRVLKVYPYHPWANIALNKADIESRSVSAETGFEHYEASSTSRDIDEEY